MRQLLEHWWQQLRIAWKHLCALWQRGLPPVLRLREAQERRRGRQVPHRRPPVRLACEVLEDINAPGNLLSAASASGVEAPPNGNVPPALSASPPPIQVIDATPAAEEAPAPPPVTRPEPKADAPAAEQPRQLEEAPKQPAVRGDGLADQLRADPMGVNPLRDPVEDENPLPPSDARDVEGDRSGSSAGSPTAAPTSGPGEGSSGTTSAGSSEGNSAASQPAGLPNNAAENAAVRLSASIQAGQAAANSAVVTPPPVVSTALVSAGLAAAATPAASPAPAASSNAAPADVTGRSAPVSAPAADSLTPLDPNINAVQGVGFSGIVGSFTDSDGNTNPNLYTVTIAFNDGTQPVAGTVGYSSGTFSVSPATAHTFPAFGTFPVVTTVHDSDGANTTITSGATVSPAITITNPGTQGSLENGSVSLSIQASDATGGTKTFFAASLPAGLSINASTGVISGTVAPGDSANGPYQTAVTVTDGTYSNSIQFSWGVTNRITLSNPGTQNSAEGSPVSLSLSDSDSGGTPVFAATGLPSGLKINTATGQITGTVAAGAAVGGPYTTTVTASDGSYQVSQSFTWNVSSPVTLAAIPNQTSAEGAAISLPVTANDTNNGATLSYGATGLPTGLKINTGTGQITGTIAAGASAGGPYTVTVTAGDGLSSASQSFTWNVNGGLVLSTPPDQNSTEGSPISLQVQVSSGGPLTYGALGLPPGLAINPGNGLISGTIIPGAAAGGPYTVTLLGNNSSASAQTTFTWNVASPVTITAPSDQSNNAGDIVSLAITANDSRSGVTLAYSATGLPPGLSISSSTGAITGTLTTGGSFSPTITVGDGTYSSSVSFNWAVASPITITDPGGQTFNAGDAVSLPITATDTASGSLHYSASGMPSGLSVNATSGVIAGTIGTSVAAGVYTSTITVTDNTNTAQLSLNWTVYPASTVVLSNPGTQTSSEGGNVSLSLSSSYTGSGSLKYCAVGLPPGLKINPSTGQITGTVASGDGVLGPYAVTVTASDGTASDSQTFTWNVSGPVTLTNPGTQSSSEGGTVSLTLSGNSGGQGTLTYAAQGLPPGLALNPSTGVISGTIAAGAAALGPYTVTVQASAGSSVAVQTFTWNVSSAVTLAAVANQTSTEGGSVSLTLSATGSSLTYAATGLPPGLTINPSTGVISGTVALGAAANGPYSVTVVAENGTTSASQSFTWNVTSPVTITQPADQTNNEGDVVSLSISSHDANQGTLKFAATGLPGLVINPSTGQITGTIPPGAAALGPYTVTIEATDGSNSGQTSFTWNVNSPVTINQPADQTSSAGSVVSLPVFARDARNLPLQYAAVGLPNGLSINPSSGVISGTLSASGSFSPTITVTDGGNYSNSVTFNWAVTGPITISDPGSQANFEGDSVSLQVSASDYPSGTLHYSASGLPAGLSISSSGLISGTVNSGDAAGSPYTVTVTATDNTNTAVDTFSWAISPAGAVVLANPGSQTNAAGDEVALSLQANDSSGGTLMYSATGLPAGLYINANTGLIFGTLPGSAVSGTPYSVTVQASDGVNGATQTFNWTVNAAGVATLTNPGDQTSNEGATVNLALTSSDSGGTLSFVAFGLPPGLKINPSNGTITGTLAVGASAGGPYTVTVMGNDGTNTASQTFAWNVNGPVTLAAVFDQTNKEGDTVSVALSGNDTISGATLRYAAFGLPAGLAINPSTGAITGTLAKGAAAKGPYSVSVVAEDGTYSATQSFTWNVNSPITFTPPVDQSNNEGDVVSLAVSATDSTQGATLSYAAVGLPAGLSINASSGVISGTVATGNAGIGSFAPTITASDGTSSSSISFNWSIGGSLALSAPNDQSNTVGDTVSLSVSATDTGGTPVYTASGLPAGLSINQNTGLISGTISSAATAIGSYPTTVTANDGSRSASVSFTWAVSAVGTITMTTPANQTSAEGANVSLSVSATGGGTKSYFAEGLPPGLVINPSTGVISGTLPVGAAAAGPYTVTVIATDGANVATETFSWTVTSTATLAAVPNQTTTEGTAVNLSLSGNDTGGTLKYAAYGLPPGLALNPSTGQITGTVALGAAANGPYTVVVVAADGATFATQTFIWTINSPITLTTPADQTNTEGDPVNLPLTAHDASGTPTFSATGLPPGLVINPSNGTISGTIAAGASASGPYTVVVTASDGTYSTSQTFTWTVNNPITINNPGPLVATEGVSFSYQVQASSSVSGTPSYYAYGLPPGLSINPNTGLISGTPVSNSQQGAGSFVIQIVGKIGNYVAVRTLPLFVVAPGLKFVNAALAQAPAPFQLTVDPVMGAPKPVAGKFGAFAWPINWKLNKVTTEGGFVLQVVTVRWKINEGRFNHPLLQWLFSFQNDLGRSFSIITKDPKDPNISQAQYVEAFPIQKGATTSTHAKLPANWVKVFKESDKLDMPDVAADDWYISRGTRIYRTGTNPLDFPNGAPVDRLGNPKLGELIKTFGWIEISGTATYYDGMTAGQLTAAWDKMVGKKLGGGFKPRKHLTGAGNLLSLPIFKQWEEHYKTFIAQYTASSAPIQHYLKASWMNDKKTGGQVTISLKQEK